jgi:hypothetical protein
MDLTSVDSPVVTCSVRAYRVLLVAYPARFRREYGPHMVQVFRDSCRQASRQGGTNGLVRLWRITLLDCLRSAFEQHTNHEARVSGSQFVKLSGFAFITGSFYFVLAALASQDPIIFYALWPTTLLLATGMLGLRVRYREIAGGFGRNILLIGVIGTVLLWVVVACQLLVTSRVLPASGFFLALKSLYVLPFAAPAILLLGLGLFGLAAVRRRPRAPLNWLPVLAGIGFPPIGVYVAGYQLAHSGALPPMQGLILGNVRVLLLVQFIALCALGAVLVADTPQEAAGTDRKEPV